MLNWNMLVNLGKRLLQVIHVDHFGVVFLSALDAGLHFVLQTLGFSTYSCFYPSRHEPHPSAHSSIANVSEFYDHLSAAHCIHHVYKSSTNMKSNSICSTIKQTCVFQKVNNRQEEH
jgi:hypothetical protein